MVPTVGMVTVVRRTSRRGYMQGYNAQAAATEQQIVIAAEVNVDSSDFGHLAGMVTATETELERADVTDTLEVVLADGARSPAMPPRPSSCAPSARPSASSARRPERAAAAAASRLIDSGAPV